ncbi:hypothetical protein GIB67_016522 [Kingdonia uniflora]|uniref:NHL repeat-containing protein n=1 Tax=Kingdonia uniflora TaxID=39325 RepID=A0A7J7NQW2_9MAGN|nr:hypothetical protein GIB67_016522 [Kingdonia uniflora]
MMEVMRKNGVVLFLIFMILFGGFSSSAEAAPPARIVSGDLSSILSAFLKWMWSLKATTKTTISGRPLMKFESGYIVETVFDGSKLGMEPYSVEVLPSGELLVLDSANSNLYKISTPLSLYSRLKLVAGSPEGYSGHVDGRMREARMSNPKGITVDDRGNIYVADTMNMAIRKISDAGVTTIAGGTWGRGGDHVDGPGEDAKFSDDFDVVYIGSSCSLLVIDRGNQAIREIQLQFDDCAYQYATCFPLGIAVLAAAGFFGYMLALLQHRVVFGVTMVDAMVVVAGEVKEEYFAGLSFVSARLAISTAYAMEYMLTIDPVTLRKAEIPPSSYQKPLRSYVRPPLIPTEDEQEKLEESLVGSLGKLFLNTGASMAEIFRGLFNFRKKPMNHQQQQNIYYQQNQNRPNVWPLQESFAIRDEDGPPPLETRTPTPQKTYAFMSNNQEKSHRFRQNCGYQGPWGEEYQYQYQQQQHHQRHYSSGPQTYYKESSETTTNEIVFGAVQEQDGRCESVVIKAVDYGDPMYNQHNIRSRINYMGYSNGY